MIKYELGWSNFNPINGISTNNGMPRIFSSTFSYGRFLNKVCVENILIFLIAVIVWLSGTLGKNLRFEPDCWKVRQRDLNLFKNNKSLPTFSLKKLTYKISCFETQLKVEFLWSFIRQKSVWKYTWILRKTSKTVISGEIEKLRVPVDNIGTNTASIIDVMAIFQKMVVE